MRFKFPVFRCAALAFGVTTSASGMAQGGMEGGGGKTVVCRNANGTIRTAEVLDLYEGRNVYALSYRESSLPWQDQAIEIFRAAGVSTSQRAPRSGIYDWFENAIGQLTFLPDGTSLKPIDDSLEAIIPQGCALEQTVNYQNDHLILVNGEIWNALSETQKAAMLIHEAVYRVLRTAGETDSRRARHFTAHIVSGNKVEDVFPGNNYQLFCRSVGSPIDTYFYAARIPATTPSEPEKLRLQFGSFGARKLMSKAYKDISLGVRGVNGTPDTDLLEQLKKPSKWIRYEALALDSLFEPGDSFDLLIHPDQNGKWGVQILGTSIVNGSTFGPLNITCAEMATY